MRPWLLPAVYERLRTGRGEFLAELRPAIPVFVRFTGIDYDADDDAIEKLDDFVRRAQRVFADYGGNLLQLTLGDKGAYLYAVFGSPLAHEDDAARACAAALEILALEGVDRRTRHPDRDRPRPPAERHVRARHAAHVRLPRRCGEPRRAADVEGAAGAGLRRRGRTASRRARHSPGSGCPDDDGERARPSRSPSSRCTG